MPNLTPKIPKEDIIKLLPDSVDQSKIMGDLIELDASASLSQARKRFFRLRLDGSPDLHLSYGEGLKDTYERSKAFNTALPQYTCKPVFLVEDGERHLSGQEFFDGTPIDESFEFSGTTEEEVTNILKTIAATFASLERPSSTEAMVNEFERFKDSVLSNENFFELDRQFLILYLFPRLKKALNCVNPTIRWSSGDLAAHNILVDGDNNFKIIDCEFAGETHFHEEDWVRLAKFASEPFNKLDFLQNRIKLINPSTHTLFHLRQTSLNKLVHSVPDCVKYVRHDLAECLWSIDHDKEKEGIGSSLLLEGIAKAKKDWMIKLYDEMVIRLAKETELAQENKIRVAKEAELAQENKIRVAKEAELATENEVRLAKEAELATENEVRLAKEAELDQSKDKIWHMQNSFSWKVTGPFRFLRRHLLDWIQIPSSQHKEDSNDRSAAPEKRTYSEWIRLYDTLTKEKIEALRKNADKLKEKPLISVLMPTFNTPEKFLHKAIESAINQIYENWELCIADDASTKAHVRNILNEYAQRDSRIKIVFRKNNGHISECSNTALGLASGEFVALLDHDDELRPHSLLRIAQAINNNPHAKVIYSDEDKINSEGERISPYFKPDWNPDLLLAQHYLCHLFCAKRSLVVEAGSFRRGYEGSQDWDLALRVVGLAEDSEIIHIPEILYHWRIHDDSTAGGIENKDYAIKAAKKAVQDHLSRNKVPAEVTISQKQFIRVRREIINSAKPKATIIIPTRDNADTLRACLESIYDKTDSSLFEILLVDNQSKELDALKYYAQEEIRSNLKVIQFDKEFNYSSINNFASEKATGDILLFLNDDTVVKNKGWLEELVSQANRKEVGAVGAKLLYPDGIYQHAGILLGYCTVAGEMMKGLPDNHPGQMQRANLVQNVSAVTGACLAIEKKKFEAIGGFDEANLKVAFNDVDLCLRLTEKGWRNVYTPHAILYHYESKSRGKEDTPSKKSRFQSEIDYMLITWGHLLKNDPAYNPNLSLNWKEQFDLAFPPRKPNGELHKINHDFS
jgi:GT2 family glycosyltransferase